MSDAHITVLAFDIGLKRTGVASGQSITKTAQAAGQILVSRGRHDWQDLDKLIEQWKPGLIVIGQTNSDDPALAKAINRFKSHIQQQHKIPIQEIDERLTSSAANAELANARLSQQRKTKLRDQIASCLILESYFNETD